MKFICVILASALFVSADFSGERCKVVHTTTSFLKCGDKVISRDAETIAAFNECTKDEEDYKLDAAFCIMEKLGALKNGSMTPSKLEELLTPTFQEHAPALVAGFAKCYTGISVANAANYQYEPIECTAKVYEDVCGHKTCDGINML